MKYSLYLVTLLILFFITPLTSFAGVFEVGGSASYRSSHLDAENYNSSFSTTMTVSYYFWEMSALELSYTNGLQKVRTKIGTDPAYIITTGFNMMGADLVFTLAGRESTIQPYFKVGAAQISKEYFREVEGNEKQKIAETSGLVPSAGVGFKIKFSKAFTVKLGLDAWISDDESIDNVSSDTLDYAGRAGVSWLF